MGNFIKQISILGLIFLIGFVKLYGQCVNEKASNDFPFTEDGITVTKTLSGDFTSYGSAYSACGIDEKAGSIWTGASGPATFRNDFSKDGSPFRMNDIEYNLAGTNLTEAFTVTVSHGTPSIIITQSSCLDSWSISGNVLTCVKDATTSGGAGARIKIHSTEPYSWINFSHNGGAGGTIFTMCFGAAFQSVKPVVSTDAITSITGTSATSGGNITSDGGSAVTARGVCWNTSGNPTITNDNTSDGTGTGTFTSSITGLSPGTTYYVRAYATNENGTAYGNQVSFTTTATPVTSLTGSSGGTSIAQNTPVYIASGANVIGTTIKGALVFINNNFNSVQDVLGIDGVQSGTSGIISYSYDSSKGILTISGDADAATYQTILRKVTYTNTSAAPSTSPRSITISLNKALPYSANGHFYEFVSSSGITWTSAKAAAEASDYFGLKGYLATITSSEENAFCASKLAGQGWIGASDAAAEGTWKWVSGPENGNLLSYTNWASGEPNNAGDEDYAHFLTNGYWNDYPNSVGASIAGYVVEYGGSAGDPTLDISDVVTVDFSVPVSTTASSIQSDSFMANWNTVSGATNYYLDVATNSSFTSMVSGYNNKNVGNVTTYKVEGLNPVTTYYYRVRGTSSGYNSNVNTATTIKADQTITFNSLTVKTYGDSDFSPAATASSGLTVTYTSSNTSVATIIGGMIHIVGSGTCTIYANQSGNTTYNAAPQVSQQLTVNKAMLTVSADAQTKIYGNINPTLTFLYSGWKNSETDAVLDTKPSASTTVNLLTNVGTHVNAISVAGGVDNNYDFTYVPANFIVNKAPLTVTADAKTKVYGDANPTLTFQYSGWKNSETDAVLDTKPTVATTVTILTNAGTHTNAITVSGGVDDNYDFTYVPANFIVNKAPLTATADAKTKIYGDTNPTLTFQYSGWKNSETDAVLDTKPTVATTVTILTNAGTHTNAITVSGGVDNNYDFTYVPANFIVNKAPLTATADAKTKIYGDANPTLTFQYSGWKNSEDESVLDTKPTVSTTVNLLTGAGTHVGAITVSGGVDNNYDFTYVPANFIVNKAPLTITAEGRIKHYDQPVPALTFKYSGWKNSDDASSLTTVPSMSTTVTISTPVGKYPNSIIGSGGVAANYDFIYKAADFEVIKTNQTIRFNALAAKTYGDASFDLFAETNSGLKVSFTSSNPSVASITGNKVTITGAGTAVITATQEGTNNFHPAPAVSQSLIVNPKTVTVEGAVAQSKIYDGTAVATIQGATLTGIVNSDEVTLANSTSGTFAQASAGTDIPVTTAMTLTGDKATNYQLVQPAGLKANIEQQLITITFEDASKWCGESDPAFTYLISPMLPEGVTISGNPSREAGEAPGKYKISKGDLSLGGNYQISILEGYLTIKDAAPVWVTLPGALNRVVEYSDAAGLAAAQKLSPEAADACDGNLSAPVKVSGQYIKLAGCEHVGSYTNTWTVTDNAGNVSEVYTQVIAIIDRIPPIVENLPSIVVTVAPGVCSTRVNYPEIKVFDDCIEKIELKSGLGKDGVFPLGTTMETWEVTDKSGNTATVYFAVNVKTYNEAPAIDQVKDLNIPKYTKEYEVDLTGIDPTGGCGVQEIVSITAEAANKLLISEAQVIYEKGQSTGKLMLKIVDKAEGESVVKVTVKDNGGTANAGADTRVMSFNVKIDRPTAVSDLSKSFEAKVYPNPSYGTVNIEITGDVASTIRIIDVTGAEVYRQTGVRGSLKNLDISRNVAGLYFVEISNEKHTLVKKLVLKN